MRFRHRAQHLVAARVAQLKGLETGEVLRATLENGKRFFNIL